MKGYHKNGCDLALKGNSNPLDQRSGSAGKKPYRRSQSSRSYDHPRGSEKDRSLQVSSCHGYGSLICFALMIFSVPTANAVQAAISNKRLVRAGILQHPWPVRVSAFIQLNRRVRNHTHGSVRGGADSAPPTRFESSVAGCGCHIAVSVDNNRGGFLRISLPLPFRASISCGSA